MKTILTLTLSLFICLANDNAIADNDNKHLQRSDSDLLRDKTSKPQEIMAFLGVSKGDHVLDFLGGSGYYSQLLAEKVGAGGKVVLHTNQAYMKYIGKELEQRSASGGLNGVTQLLSEADNLKFGEQQFDSAILVLGYHDFFFLDEGWDFPSDKVIPQVLKALKPGGKLLIIDHAAAEGAGISVAKSLHRIEGGFVKKDIEHRGFRFVKESKILRNEEDPMDIVVFDPKVRRQTDRFVYLFEKK